MRPTLKTHVIVVGIAFALIALGWIFQQSEINISLFHVINQALPISAFWLPLSEIGSAVVTGCAAYLVFRHQPRWLFTALIAGLITHFASQEFKLLFHSLRPEHTLSANQIFLLGPALEANNYAFPSGHSMTAFMALGLFLATNRLARPVFILASLLAILVPIARIAVGAHWPSDCLAGAGIGLLIAMVAYGIGITLPKTFIDHKGTIAFIYICFACFIFFTLKSGLRYAAAFPVTAGFYFFVGFISAGVLLFRHNPPHSKR